MNKVFCEHCGELDTVTPEIKDEESGVTWCVWCAYANDLITSPQLADYERQGWAAGESTLPHTFRQDQIDK